MSLYNWPDNGPMRLQEDQTLLDKIADLMKERFEPHALNCKDAGCGRALLNDNDWARIYALEDHMTWLKERALHDLLAKEMRN